MNEVFNNIFENATTTVEYNKKWENGTGYLDNLRHMVKLSQGEIAKSTDPHGRKIIILGTCRETVCFFERYAGNGSPIVGHCWRGLEKILSNVHTNEEVAYVLELSQRTEINDAKEYALKVSRDIANFKDVGWDALCAFPSEGDRAPAWVAHMPPCDMAHLKAVKDDMDARRAKSA